VCLLERDALSSGSTSRAAGGIRTQFSDPLNIAIGLRSVEAFSHFAERPGGEIDFHQVGYLFLLDRAEDVASFEQSVALQNELGVPSRVIEPAEAAKLSPLAGLDGVLAATYCPLDGHASPEAVALGYAAAARTHGATVLTGRPASAIEVADGKVERVVTDAGAIETGTVVLAAGVWSPGLARTAGVDLPVEPIFREVVTTAPVEGLPERIPLTVDFSTGFYFHREGPGLAFGGREDTLDELAEPATRRLPVLADLPVQASWWGFYEVSPDWNAIVGETSEPERFFYATGFSGHGFQQSPAVGEHVAELVTGRTPALDLSAFSLERFARGELRREQFVI
jgi:sarcosine oxidase, subunit beta